MISKLEARSSKFGKKLDLPTPSSQLRAPTDGYTIVEGIVSLAILTIIILALMQLFISGSRQYQEESTRSGLQVSATTFNDGFEAEAQTAFGVEATYGSYVSGASTIILDVPGIDASKNIISPFVTDRIIYTLSGSQILKSVVPAATSSRTSLSSKSVLTKVTAFTITYPAGITTSNRISWTVSVQGSYQNRVATVSNARTAKLRNKT